MTHDPPRRLKSGKTPLPAPAVRLPLRCGLPSPAKHRGRTVSCLAVLLCLVLLGHAHLPAVLGFRLAVESALPWLGLAIPVLLIWSVVLRTKAAAALVLAAALCWFGTFGSGTIPPAPAGPSSGPTVTVATQNLSAANPDPVETLRELSLASPDIVALQEVAGTIDPADFADWPHQARAGTVMLLSKYPIIDAEPLTLGLGLKRALHATVDAEAGPISVYVVHAASARLTEHSNRDTMLRELAAAIAADVSPRIIALGDFNASTYDTSLSAVSTLLPEPAPAAGGFGFTWPRGFPLIRLDHILTRGFPNASTEVLDTTGSDHLGMLGTLAS